MIRLDMAAVSFLLKNLQTMYTTMLSTSTERLVVVLSTDTLKYKIADLIQSCSASELIGTISEQIKILIYARNIDDDVP